MGLAQGKDVEGHGQRQRIPASRYHGHGKFAGPAVSPAPMVQVAFRYLLGLAEEGHARGAVELAARVRDGRAPARRVRPPRAGQFQDADYSYVDEMGTDQLIHFASVRSQNDVTYASGKVEQVSNFTMSPHFAFKGGVELQGNDPLFTFTGFTKIIHPCSNLINEWLNFESKIDPKDIMIPIGDNPKNDEDLPLFNGFLFASDSTGLYPAIFTKKRRFTDYEVLKVPGYLKYDRKNKEFRVGSKEKLADRNLSGPYLSFNTMNCTSYGEGRMDLGSKMGQVELKAAGNILYFPDSDSTELNLTLSIDFPFPNELKKIIGTGFENLEGSSLDLKDEETVKFLTDMLDSTTSEKAFAGIKEDGKFKRLPKEFDKTFVFNNVKLSWWKRDRALQYSGESGLVVYNGEQILKPLSLCWN